MNEKDGPASGQGETPVDPSLWRGLTQSRLSRRQVLASAGTGAGALGLSALSGRLRREGHRGAQRARPARPAASAPRHGGPSSKLHHTVNFANWPYYIDVLNGKHPSLEQFTQTDRHQGQLHRADQRQRGLLRQDPAIAGGQAVHRLRHHRDDQQHPERAGVPAAERLADPARPVDDDQLPQVRQQAGDDLPVGPRQQVHDGLAVGLHRDRLQLLGDQEPRRPAWTSCSTRSTRARSA